MWVTLTTKSGNRKVGKVAVSTSEEASCPKECPMHGTDCYARFGPLGIHWKKVKEGMRGTNWPEFCQRLLKLPSYSLFRHNQAGDLPQNKKGKIHKLMLRMLVKSCKHLRAWTYTHYDPFDEHNAEAIREANKVDSITINLSADSLTQADAYVKLGIAPVTVVLPSDAPKRGNKTPGGLPIVVCPAQTVEHMNCEQCKLCIKKHRKSIVGFLAHGTAQKRLSKRLAEKS